MGRTSRTAKAFTWIALALVLLTVPVVAEETWREYDSWENRPLGVLEVLFDLTNHDLPPMPDWSCDKTNPPRLVNGQLTVRLLSVGAAANPYTETQWEELLGQRLGVPVDVVPGDLVVSTEAAREAASKDRGTVHLALQHGYFRGPNLNERIEGIACTNFAVINDASECQEGVAAHEIGHVLGLSHSKDGLMRARAAPCPATLSPAETAYLLARSQTSVPLVS